MSGKHFSSVPIIGVSVGFCCSNEHPQISVAHRNNYFSLPLCEGCGLAVALLGMVGLTEFILALLARQVFKFLDKNQRSSHSLGYALLTARCQGSRRWENRGKPCKCCKASALIWHKSCPLEFHWLREVTWPSSELLQWGNILCLQEVLPGWKGTKNCEPIIQSTILCILCLSKPLFGLL